MGAAKKTLQKTRPCPYPYTILPVQPPSLEIAKRLTPLAVMEFFRIEALLRSKKVQGWYGKYYTEGDPEDGDDYLAVYHHVGGGWEALKGAHHCLLLPTEERQPAWELGPGIMDVAAYYGSRPGMYKYLIEDMKDSQKAKRYMWLRLDAAYPPGPTLSQLLPHLKRLYEQARRLCFSPETFLVPVFFKFKPGDKSGIHGYKSIITWLKYFRCYDLRTTQGISYGDVAKQVYGSKEDKPKLYALAKKACERVDKLIKAAEARNWPPAIQ